MHENKDTVSIWMEDFKNSDRSIDEEIEGIKGTISNERLWLKGSDSQEQIDMHTQNIADLEAYLADLKGIKTKEEIVCI